MFSPKNEGWFMTIYIDYGYNLKCSLACFFFPTEYHSFALNTADNNFVISFSPKQKNNQGLH